MANPWTRDQLDKNLPSFKNVSQQKKIIEMLLALKQEDESQKSEIQDLKSRVEALENPVEQGN